MKEIFEGMDEAIELFSKATEKLKRYTTNDMAINIIIDDSDPQNPIFVEAENDNGQSIAIGEDSRTDENYRKIRITVGDIIGHEKI